MRRAIVAVILVATIADPARAEPLGLVSPTATPPIFQLDTAIAEVAPTVEPTGYRWQLALADLAALGTLVLGGQSGNDGVTTVAIGTYALGAPIIHGANGHGLRAVGSLALRIGLPLLGAYAGGRVQTNHCPPDAKLCGDGVPQGGVVLGAALGVLTAVIIDMWLARPVTKKQRLSPVATTGSGSTTAGFSGRF